MKIHRSIGSPAKLAAWSLCLTLGGLLLLVLLISAEVQLSGGPHMHDNMTDKEIAAYDTRTLLLNTNFCLFSVCPMLWLMALVTGIIARQYPMAQWSIVIVVPVLAIFSFNAYLWLTWLF